MMNIPKDKQCYIDACLPDNTPHDKGIGKGYEIVKQPIPIKVITISAQEAKDKYREQSLLRYISKGQS